MNRPDPIKWAFSCPIKSGPKMVLVALAAYADRDTGQCYPGQDRLAEMCSMDRSTVNQHIKALVAAGLVTMTRRTGKSGHRTSNLYTLAVKVNSDTAKVAKPNVENPNVGKTNVGISPIQCSKSQQELSDELSGRVSVRAREGRPTPTDAPAERHGSQGQENQPQERGVQSSPERREPQSDTQQPTQLKPISDFDRFWSAFPNKKSKGQARKAWEQTRKSRPPLPQLLEAIEKAKAGRDWIRDGGKYIPHPATWLRAEGWEDEVAPAGVASTDRGPVSANHYNQNAHGGNHGRGSRKSHHAQFCEEIFGRVERTVAEEMGGGPVREDDGDLWGQVVEFLPIRAGAGGRHD